MSAFLKSAPAGVLGDVTRVSSSVVEPIMMSAQFNAYGAPVKLDANGKATPFVGGEAAAAFVGILTRMTPSISGNTNQGLSDTIPWLKEPQGLLKWGYANVACAQGTPVRGGTVYARIVAAAGKNIGDLEALADGLNNIALTNAEWASNGKDANNIAEIRLK